MWWLRGPVATLRRCQPPSWPTARELATAVAAWYASFAAVTNSTFGRTVLPVMPLKR
jgi:hypothetical protein